MYSGIVDLQIKIAPALRNFSTTEASSLPTTSARANEPDRQGISLTEIESFTEIGMPNSGKTAPCMRIWSALSA